MSDKTEKVTWYDKQRRMQVAIEQACLEILESENVSLHDKLQAAMILRGEK